jgi:glycine/betaine/sarcosine/D-proline reductase family selenoprotein B
VSEAPAPERPSPEPTSPEPTSAQPPEPSGPYATPLLNRLRAHLHAGLDPEYEFLAFDDVPWTKPRAAVRELRVALLATADLHRRGDEPFISLDTPWGDTSFRVIPHTLEEIELALDAPYVDGNYIPRDPEVALPRRALDELVAAGEVGAAAARHYSFCQGIVRALPGLADSAERVAASLREDRIDAVVLLPTCSLCVQTVAVLARELEARGFATVTVTTLPELTTRVGAPRALATKFPFGAPAGDPGHRALHVAVLREALALVDTAREPRGIVESTLRWRRD